MSAVLSTVHEGPDLPPVTDHLSRTPAENLKSLFVHAIVQALRDCDTAWINSPEFVTICEYAGLDDYVPERIRAAYNRGLIDPHRLENWNTGLGAV